jgi:hypothetical protein
VLLASFLCLAAALHAQQQCIATHDDGTLVDNTVTGGFPLGYRLTAAAGARITAVQVHTGLRAGAASLAIWSHDATSNAPAAILGQRADYVQRTLIGWQGGVLPQPVQLAAGQVFWVVWTAPDSSRTNWSTDPAGTVPYRALMNGTWSGPAQGWGPAAAKIRLHCDYPTGTTAVLGAAQAGSGGVLPALSLAGWPSVGNAIEPVLERAAPSAQALLLIGSPGQLPVPGLGTLEVLPWVSLALTTSSGRTPGTGAATLEIRLPNDPSLAGAAAAFQWWIVDSGAANGLLAHTAGLLTVFN